MSIEITERANASILGKALFGCGYVQFTVGDFVVMEGVDFFCLALGVSGVGGVNSLLNDGSFGHRN